jgi:2'-phosphotransferase
MAAELRIDMRTDGYVRVRDLLKLNLQTFAKAPLKSHTVDEIREVSMILVLFRWLID